MPLGILSENEALIELERLGIISNEAARPESDNIINFHEMKRGRGETKEIPESVRSFVAIEAICGADVDKLSSEMNVSRASISAYKNGATSTATYNEPNARLVNTINEARNQIIGPAQSRILKAIQSITDEKLNSSKARDAASIASSLSSVIKNISPDNAADNKVQINVFAPRKNEEEDYDIIRVDS